jgi:hypothetical protein
MSFVAIAIGVSVVGTVGGTVISAVGASEAADARAKTDAYNQQVQLNNETAAAQQTRFDALQIAEKTRRQVALQRAAMASSGFDVNKGTFNDLTFDTKRQGEMERLSRIYVGSITAGDSSARAALYKAQIGNDQAAGTASILGDAFQGVGALGQLGSNPSLYK